MRWQSPTCNSQAINPRDRSTALLRSRIEQHDAGYSVLKICLTSTLTPVAVALPQAGTLRCNSQRTGQGILESRRRTRELADSVSEDDWRRVKSDAFLELSAVFRWPSGQTFGELPAQRNQHSSELRAPSWMANLPLMPGLIAVAERNAAVSAIVAQNAIDLPLCTCPSDEARPRMYSQAAYAFRTRAAQD